MAKYFLDTNFFMRTYEGKLLDRLSRISGHEVSISALSIHIACYVHKVRLPNKVLNTFLDYFTIYPVSTRLVSDSLAGPTTDFEDNMQLNTASLHQISTFVTMDQELLNLKTFQGMRIISPEDL